MSRYEEETPEITQEKYYYQHEDTGHTCCISSPEPPSKRWYPISETAYRAHEAQNNAVYETVRTKVIDANMPGDPLAFPPARHGGHHWPRMDTPGVVLVPVEFVEAAAKLAELHRRIAGLDAATLSTMDKPTWDEWDRCADVIGQVVSGMKSE